jgi:hypothetical protein
MRYGEDKERKCNVNVVWNPSLASQAGVGLAKGGTFVHLGGNKAPCPLPMVALPTDFHFKSLIRRCNR